MSTREMRPPQEAQPEIPAKASSHILPKRADRTLNNHAGPGLDIPSAGAGLGLARELLAAGIPIVICRPRLGWKHGDTRLDVLPPAGWSVITAAECDLSRYRAGIDTLAMVGGHGVDVVDSDPKNGGSLDNMPPFRRFGRNRTPSGGTHDFVRSTGIGKISPLTTNAGHVGDYVGGTAQGGGRALAFLPGSSRPKYPGAAYEVIEALDLHALLESDPDEDLVNVLDACGGTRAGLPGEPAAKLAEVRAFLAEHSAEPRQECAYGRAAMAGMLQDVQATRPGDTKAGRHGWAVRSAARCVELIRTGCASSADLDTLHAELDRIKPEGGSDWTGILAWALNNADSAVGCSIHNPTHDEAATTRDLPKVKAAAPDAADGARRVVLTKASTIRPRPVFWLWTDRLALGTLGLLSGREGLGKSTLAYWIAARITRGDLPGHYQGTPKGVLVCATEDSWEHTIVPRLMAADADLTCVYRVEVLNADDIHVGLSLPRDLLAVERSARAADSALLLLDPLMSRMPDLDTHRDAEVRMALEPLVALADRTSMSVLGLIHHNKSGSTDPLQLVMASKAFTAVARSVHTVVPDPDDDTDTVRLFGTPKNNLGRADLPTLSFTIGSHAIDTDEGTAWTGQLEWGEEVAASIGDTMRRAAESHEDRSASSEAAEWLEDYVAMNGGRVSSAAAKKDGAGAGHSIAAIKRARQRLQLRVSSGGYPRVTWWESNH